jgi:hypothetical protein
MGKRRKRGKEKLITTWKGGVFSGGKNFMFRLNYRDGKIRLIFMQNMHSCCSSVLEST